MSDFYSTQAKDQDEEHLKTIKAALDIGINYFDTSDIYGLGHNEELLGKAIARFGREKFIVGEKIGVVRLPDGSWRGTNGKRDFLRQQIDTALKRLGTTYIDLVYFNRNDPNTPIEDTIAALAEMVKEGKIKYIGLSEHGSESIRKAHAVHPITAVQTEYSLWSLDVEAKVLPTCRELGIGLVAYSPLGRGFLTGKIKSPADLADNDFRKHLPRFSAENFPKNIELVHKLEDIAKQKGCTTSQLAIAWLLSKGKDIFPLFGTTKIASVIENAEAAKVTLTEEELKKINELTTFPTQGTRYPAQALAAITTDK
jgi:aryl-alcohol dehydrogenase-like predicted oxidoreductase